MDAATAWYRLKKALGMAPADINLPLSGATPEARRRAESDKYDAERKRQQQAKPVKPAPRPSVNPLKRLGDAIETQGASERHSEAYSYDFRSRNNLKRGNQ